MIGFNDTNHNVTEGVGMFTDITVDLLNGKLGQNVEVTVNTQAVTAKGKFNKVSSKCYKIMILSSFITIFVDGEDFDSVTDHQLTFSPSVTSLPVPINIRSDGDFEETEKFSVILSVRNFGLQLNNGTVNLKQRVCKDEGIFSISSSDVQSGDHETVNIDLDRIFVSQSGNNTSFKLAATESEWVSVGPAKTSVTIFDNDSKL